MKKNLVCVQSYPPLAARFITLICVETSTNNDLLSSGEVLILSRCHDGAKYNIMLEK